MCVQSSKSLKRYNHLIGELEGVYHEAALKLGMSDSVCKILYTICNEGGECLLNGICKLTGLSKQTVNSAIRNLEGQGLVVLRAVDGKAKEVVLTERGREMGETTALRIIRIENEIFASWQESDVETYLALTNRFLEDLRRKVAKL